MIKDSAYWMGRDVKYASELTGEIEENAKELIGRVNNLLASILMGEREVRSGWRPQGVNDATKNAAASSKHITGQAVDLADNDRSLAKAIMLDPEALETFGLWMEDTRWTPTWVHLQSVPPKSGKRIYIPNASPPIAPPVIA